MTPLEWAKKCADEVGGAVDPYKLAVYFSLAVDEERDRLKAENERDGIHMANLSSGLSDAIEQRDRYKAALEKIAPYCKVKYGVGEEAVQAVEDALRGTTEPSVAVCGVCCELVPLPPVGHGPGKCHERRESTEGGQKP